MTSRFPSMSSQLATISTASAEESARREIAAIKAADIVRRRMTSLKSKARKKLRPDIHKALESGPMMFGQLSDKFKKVSRDSIKGMLKHMIADEEVQQSGTRGAYLYSLTPTNQKGAKK